MFRLASVGQKSRAILLLYVSPAPQARTENTGVLTQPLLIHYQHLLLLSGVLFRKRNPCIKQERGFPTTSIRNLHIYLPGRCRSPPLFQRELMFIVLLIFTGKLVSPLRGVYLLRFCASFCLTSLA